MKKQAVENYRQAVEYLYDVPRFTSKGTMEDTRRFLRELGSPERDMRIVHVAGTNGKGSVCAYLSGILREAGYSCGVFTSPHLVEARERFAVNGEIISEEAFYDAFLQVYNRLDWEKLEEGTGYHPTFFEYLFFMAMLIFREKRPDYCILETGLGGRLDATNAVEKKELSVITRIGMDHMEYLGGTLEEIAGEKAGIIAKDTPVVYLEEVPEAAGVIRDAASKKCAPAYGVSKEDYTYLNFQNKSIDFSYHSRYYGYIKLCLHTIARYQMENAALAVKAAEVLDQGKTISRRNIMDGIGKTLWKGRMEEVRREFYVDGAHNMDGVRAFLETVAQDGWQGKRHLIYSVVKDKEYTDMTREIAVSGLFASALIVQMQGKRALRAEEILEIWEQYTESEAHVYRTAGEAVRAAAGAQTPEDRIYAAGSLYLAGEIKSALERHGY